MVPKERTVETRETEFHTAFERAKTRANIAARRVAGVRRRDRGPRPKNGDTKRRHKELLASCPRPWGKDKHKHCSLAPVLLCVERAPARLRGRYVMSLSWFATLGAFVCVAAHYALGVIVAWVAAVKADDELAANGSAQWRGLCAVMALLPFGASVSCAKRLGESQFAWPASQQTVSRISEFVFLLRASRRRVSWKTMERVLERLRRPVLESTLELSIVPPNLRSLETRKKNLREVHGVRIARNAN